VNFFKGTAWRGALSGYFIYFAILFIAGDYAPTYSLTQSWLLSMAFSITGIIIELLLRKSHPDDDQENENDG